MLRTVEGCKFSGTKSIKCSCRKPLRILAVLKAIPLRYLGYGLTNGYGLIKTFESQVFEEPVDDWLSIVNSRSKKNSLEEFYEDP